MAILQRVSRSAFLVLGVICVGLGIVGAFVPVMPTTIFLILAVGCFSKSDPRLERRLLDHPRFGPVLSDWRSTKSIRRKTKFVAIATIIVTISLSVLAIHKTWVQALVGGIGIGVCLYIWTRRTKPEPSTSLR